jgi:hypothetical protein
MERHYKLKQQAISNQIKMADKLTTLVNTLITEKPTQELLVNDKIFKNEVGIKTESGWYKNGWTTKSLDGKTNKYKYIQLDIYTSNWCLVAKELQVLFKFKNQNWNIVKMIGFHGTNLLNFDDEEEHIKYMTEYITALLKK